MSDKPNLHTYTIHIQYIYTSVRISKHIQNRYAYYVRIMRVKRFALAFAAVFGTREKRRKKRE